MIGYTSLGMSLASYWLSASVLTITSAPSFRQASIPAWKAAARPLLFVRRTTWSTPCARATSIVRSVEPSSMTSHSTSSKPRTARGRSPSVAGSCSSSLRHGIWMISFMRRAIVAGRSQAFSMALAEPTTKGRGARLAARAEALATRRNATLAAVLAGFVVLLLFFGLRTYPNYDSYYQLLWGQDLAHGHLPDYTVFRSPTPHPLSVLVGFVLSPFGLAADRLMVLLTLGAWVGLLWAVYRFTKQLLGTLIAAVAVVVMLTRTDLEFFALRGVVDIWFLFFIFTAAALEVHRPRRGMPVMLLLTLAGLLRPEAWVLAGIYVLWLFPQKGLRGIWPYVLLAAAAPVIWVAWDWIVTGKPLYSLTSTRETAGEFKRDRGVIEAIKLVPDYIGANEKIVNVVIGGLGAPTALWFMRRRALVPLALMALGVLTLLAIAAAGRWVIPRYLAIPSILFNISVAVALTGWIVVKVPRRAHRLFVV